MRGDAVEVETDGFTVWVNDRGVDVHADYETQVKGGHQCLDCVHGLPFEESWLRFQQSMLEHYGVVIEDNLKPKQRLVIA